MMKENDDYFGELEGGRRRYQCRVRQCIGRARSSGKRCRLCVGRTAANQGAYLCWRHRTGSGQEEQIARVNTSSRRIRRSIRRFQQRRHRNEANAMHAEETAQRRQMQDEIRRSNEAVAMLAEETAQRRQSTPRRSRRVKRPAKYNEEKDSDEETHRRTRDKQGRVPTTAWFRNESNWERNGNVISLRKTDGTFEIHTYIGQSSIPNAGRGLFAARSLAKGTHIGAYTGRQLGIRADYVTETELSAITNSNDKILGIEVAIKPETWTQKAFRRWQKDNDRPPEGARRRTLVDGQESKTGYIQYANHAPMDTPQNNAICGRTGLLVASRRTAKDEEILWDYGTEYWT